MDKNIDESRFKKLFSEFKKNFDWFADFEIFIAAVIAALIVIISPLILTLYFAKHSHPWYALGLGLVWLYSVVQLVKDYRRKKFSLFSKVFFLVWLVLLGIIVLLFIVVEILS